MYFTVEEENLICLYHNADRRRTAANLRAALPDMDKEMAAPSKTGPSWPISLTAIILWQICIPSLSARTPRISAATP